MINAKDFFYTADDEIKFTIALDNGDELTKPAKFYEGITRDEIIPALDLCSTYEEIYKVSFFNTSMIEPRKMYVWIASENNEYTMMQTILAMLTE